MALKDNLLHPFIHRFTFNCLRIPAYYDEKNQNYDRSIEFRGQNDDVINNDSPGYNVPKDGCKVPSLSLALLDLCSPNA